MRAKIVDHGPADRGRGLDGGAFVVSGNARMLGTSIVMGASNLEDLLRGLVQARARTLGLDEIVVADHGEDRGRLVPGWTARFMCSAIVMVSSQRTSGR